MECERHRLCYCFTVSTKVSHTETEIFHTTFIIVVNTQYGLIETMSVLYHSILNMRSLNYNQTTFFFPNTLYKDIGILKCVSKRKNQNNSKNEINFLKIRDKKAIN